MILFVSTPYISTIGRTSFSIADQRVFSEMRTGGEGAIQSFMDNYHRSNTGSSNTSSSGNILARPVSLAILDHYEVRCSFSGHGPGGGSPLSPLDYLT